MPNSRSKSRLTSNRPCNGCGKSTRAASRVCAKCQHANRLCCADCGAKILNYRNVTGVCGDCYQAEIAAVGQRDSESPNVLRGGRWELDPVSRARKWVAA